MQRLGNQLRAVFLLGVLAAALAGVAALFGTTAAMIGLAIALAIDLGAYFWSDRIVLAASHARPLARHEAPELHRIVHELARAAAIPTPRLYLVPDPAPNAFATGRNPAHGAVAVTAGLLERLALREIRGVLAHEIAHIKNRDVLVATIAAAMASAIGWVASLLSFSAWTSHDEDAPSPATGLLFALIAPIAATLIQLGISRSREYLADADAARLTGEPDALADALQVIAGHRGAATTPPAVASLMIASPLAGGVDSLFSTHPPIHERIRRLRGARAAAAWQPFRWRPS